MTKTKSMIYCGLFTALIAAGAFIKNPYTCGSFYTAVPVHYACRIVSGIQKGYDFCGCLYAVGTGRTSDLFGGRWDLVYFQAKLRLYYRVLPGNIRDRTYCRAS